MPQSRARKSDLTGLTKTLKMLKRLFGMVGNETGSHIRRSEEDGKMKPKKYISKFRDLLHKMNMDGHINKPDKYTAVKDIEIAVHKLEQAFERDIK